MKKLLTLASILLMAAGIILSISIAAFAESGVLAASSESGFEYVDANGDTQIEETDLAKAISGALKGTRVMKLRGDTEYIVGGNREQIVMVNNDLEIDLCGHTLTILQGGTDYAGRRYINISAGVALTVKNGTLCVRRCDSGNESISYPLFYFRDSKSGSTLNLENVNTYSGTLIYANKSTDATVNVTGGNHYTTHHKTLGYDDKLTDGGFIDSRTSTTFTASDALFFTDKSSFIVASLSTNTTLPSSFTFNNCTLISDPGDTDGSYTLVKYANSQTTLTFNGCDIYGSIAPIVSPKDENASPITAENVIFGYGTRISDAMTYSDYTIDGGVLNSAASTVNLDVIDCADDVSVGFSFTPLTIECVYTHEVGDEAAAEYTVTWHDANGDVIHTEKVTRGTTITPPDYQIPEKINNGWVYVIFDSGWSRTLYGEATEMTVTEDVSLYPSASKSLANLSAFMHNLSLFGNVTLNAYLPLESAPDGIELVEVQNGDGETIACNDLTVIDSGIRYAWYTVGSVGAIELGTELEVSVKFLFNGIEFSQTFSLSPAKYAETVLSSTSSWGDAKQMIADMIIYSNSIWQYVNGTAENDPALDALITAYRDLATPSEQITSESFTQGALGDYEALVPYVSSLTFDVAAYEPCYLIVMNDTAHVKDVRFITANGVVYDMNDTTAEYGDDEYLDVARSIGMSLYYIDSNVEIVLTVADDDGEEREVRGTYTLNDYYNGVYPTVYAESPESAARLDTLMRALRAYAASALAYQNR